MKKCPRCGNEDLELISTTNPLRNYCKPCDLRFDDQGFGPTLSANTQEFRKKVADALRRHADEIEQGEHWLVNTSFHDELGIHIDYYRRPAYKPTALGPVKGCGGFGA